MKKTFQLGIGVGLLASALATAAPVPDAPKLPAGAQSGVARMQSIMEGVTTGNTSALSDSTQKAVTSGAQSATVSADLNRMDNKTVQFSVDQAQKWEQMAREAYVAALPKRDQPLGKSLLLGDGSLPGGSGKLYFFVSRSMPESLLRAYSVAALYTGAELVVKGVRKGDTIKEYFEEVISNFNSADGMLLAGMQVNPNLYDMFNVTVVPSVVWTSRIGLDDVGSGCQNLPDDAPVEKLTLQGPDNEPVTVDKPTCAPAAPSSFYKISGALTLEYVLERFQDAGAPKAAMESLRKQLAMRHANVNDGTVRQAIGNGMAPITGEVKLDMLPKEVLLTWADRLKSGNVQRGPFGPTFSPDNDDDPVYRKELMDKITHGLGL